MRPTISRCAGSAAMRRDDLPEPMTSLNPVPISVRWPSPAAASRHGPAAGGGPHRPAAPHGIPAPEKRIDDYPHQWSGGMMKRAVIAMAARAPRLMRRTSRRRRWTSPSRIRSGLLLELQRDGHGPGAGLPRYGHRRRGRRPGGPHAGRIVQLAPTAAIFEAPAHPYTQGLLRSVPRLEGRSTALAAIPGQPPDPARLPRLRLRRRCPLATAGCRAPITLRQVGWNTGGRAIDQVATLDWARHTTAAPVAGSRRLVLVRQDPLGGRSGRVAILLSCGPSTACRSRSATRVLGLVGEAAAASHHRPGDAGLFRPSTGHILFEGQDLRRLDSAASGRKFRRRVRWFQILFLAQPEASHRRHRRVLLHQIVPAGGRCRSPALGLVGLRIWPVAGRATSRRPAPASGLPAVCRPPESSFWTGRSPPRTSHKGPDIEPAARSWPQLGPPYLPSPMSWAWSGTCRTVSP